jgi:hypothetical protein
MLDIQQLAKALPWPSRSPIAPGLVRIVGILRSEVQIPPVKQKLYGYVQPIWSYTRSFIEALFSSHQRLCIFKISYQKLTNFETLKKVSNACGL